jgi:RND family efflux transporter MFP subunit
MGQCFDDRLTTSALAIVFVAGGAGLLSSCGRSSATANGSEAPAVAVTQVRRVDLSRAVVITAELRPYQEIDVHAKVAGYVRQMAVDVGDRVTTGQPLATLEIPELEDDVHQADAAVSASTSEVDKARAEVDRAQSAYDAAHLAATRLANVSKAQPGLVAQQEIDEALGRDRVDAAQVVTAKAAVAAAEQQVQVAKAQQARTHALFDYSRITAPFAGVVTKRYADTGSMIQAGTSSQTQAMPLVRLAEDDRLRLVIPVPESAVPNIHTGGAVEVQVPVLNRTFTGTVARFASQVDPATRTMHTEVDVENPARQLVPGMYAEVSVTLATRPAALAVPIQALDRAEDRVSVMRVGPDRTVEVRPVQIGLETAAYAEVLAGLAEGDLVIVGGRSQLHAGIKVDPRSTTALPAAGGR